MYIQPQSLLSRLLGAVWTILFICGLLWLAARLLEQAWVGIVVIIVVAALVRGVVWWHRLRHEYW